MFPVSFTLGHCEIFPGKYYFPINLFRWKIKTPTSIAIYDGRLILNLHPSASSYLKYRAAGPSANTSRSRARKHMMHHVGGRLIINTYAILVQYSKILRPPHMFITFLSPNWFFCLPIWLEVLNLYIRFWIIAKNSPRLKSANLFNNLRLIRLRSLSRLVLHGPSLDL